MAGPAETKGADMASKPFEEKQIAREKEIEKDKELLKNEKGEKQEKIEKNEKTEKEHKEHKDQKDQKDNPEVKQHKDSKDTPDTKHKHEKEKHEKESKNEKEHKLEGKEHLLEKVHQEVPFSQEAVAASAAGAVAHKLPEKFVVEKLPQAETKIHKEIKSEIKEFKHEKFEIKEQKHEKFEIKEFKLEKFEHEGLSGINEPGGPVEQRLAALEAAMTQLMHFIPENLRPDLTQGALKQEPDAGKHGGSGAAKTSDSKTDPPQKGKS
jgi:hypothetical protein